MRTVTLMILTVPGALSHYGSSKTLGKPCAEDDLPEVEEDEVEARR